MLVSIILVTRLGCWFCWSYLLAFSCRYENGSAYYHEDDREGLLKICRLVIHTRYEDYTIEGFNVLYAKQPVIYISSAARTGLGQALCNQVKSIIWGFSCKQNRYAFMLPTRNLDFKIYADFSCKKLVLTVQSADRQLFCKLIGDSERCVCLPVTSTVRREGSLRFFRILLC